MLVATIILTVIIVLFIAPIAVNVDIEDGFVTLNVKYIGLKIFSMTYGGEEFNAKILFKKLDKNKRGKQKKDNKKSSGPLNQSTKTPEKKMSLEEKIIQKSQQWQDKAKAMREDLEREELENDIKKKQKQRSKRQIKTDENIQKTEFVSEKRVKKKRSQDPIFDKVVRYVEFGSKVGERLLNLKKWVKIKGLKLDLSISDFDAAECAVKYGKISGIVYYAIGVTSTHIKTDIKRVYISCVYDKRASRYDGSATIKIISGPVILESLRTILGIVRINNR